MLISFLVSVIYSPHILLSVGFAPVTINELLDIVLFFAVGIIVGTLNEKKSIKNNKLQDELKKHIILEQYTNSIIESIKSGVIVINKDMFITIINQGAIEILDANHDCVDQNFMEIFHCCRDIKLEILNAINEGKTAENIEVQLDKKQINVNISIYPLTLNSTNKGLVIIIDDITELKKLQQQALRNEKLVALGELSSGIAHEIRNPLAIIKAIEQTMKGELKNNEEAMKELEIIDEEVERANKIVKALMEFAKPSKSSIQLYRVNDIVDEVLLIINKYAIQRNIGLEAYIAGNAQVLADKEQLKQAFINIIFNAVESMPTGGILKVSSNIDNDRWVKLVFEDTGTGIETENILKIFNPFFTTKEQGTGLGLSIVHRILEEHGCIINVISDLGKGTKFEIMFPIIREGEAF
jgi:PAS domain S-box-containing protein